MKTDLNADRLAAAQFRALLNSKTQGIIGVDSKGIIQMINPKAAELFGYAPEDLVGEKLDLLVPDRLHSVHAEEVTEFFDHPRARPMGIGVEVTGRRRDGSEFRAEVSLNPVDLDGEILVLGLISDTTERLELEENARRAEKMGAVGRLATGVARELEGLLFNVSEHLKAASLWGEPDPALQNSMEVISGSAENATRLMGQLLAIGGFPLMQPEWLDPGRQLTEMHAALSRLVGPGIELEIVVGEDLGEILADPRQIEYVISVLVQNASDAMPRGGVVRIEAATIEVGEEYADCYLPISPGSHIRLTIADTGIGMSTEVREHLFEPFFTTKTMGRCRGLDLATVYGIVKNWGGTISATSEPDRGTSFTLIMPRIVSRD